MKSVTNMARQGKAGKAFTITALSSVAGGTIGAILLMVFGIWATALKFADYPLAPLLIGFILGGMMEDDFSHSNQNNMVVPVNRLFNQLPVCAPDETVSGR